MLRLDADASEHSEENIENGDRRDKLSINLILPSSLNFYGGGEAMAISISSGMNKVGLKTILYDKKNYSGLSRVPDSYLEDLGVNRKQVDMIPIGKIKKIFFHDFPSKELLSEGSLNMILIWRVPSREQLKMVIYSEVPTIFLLHGIALEKIRLSNPIIILYQLFLRLQMHNDRKLFLNPNLNFQCLNTSQANYLRKVGISSDKIFTIKNGIQTEIYKVGKNNSEFRILFVGRSENLQKGINRLIRIGRIVNRKGYNIKFVVIGSGKYSPMLRRIRYIDYLGYVTPEVKLQELEKSNLLLVTSNMEPFGLTLLEGILSGLPVVSTPASGPSDIINLSPLFGKASSFRASILARDIISYYDDWKNDPKKYFTEKMIRRKDAERLFTEKKMIDNYAKMAKKIMGQSPCDLIKQPYKQENRMHYD